MRLLGAITAVTLVLGTSAFADPGKSKGNGNNDQAQAMSTALQANKGFASIASKVSGYNPELGIGGRSASGWGNTGSSLDDGNSVSGKITSN